MEEMNENVLQLYIETELNLLLEYDFSIVANGQLTSCDIRSLVALRAELILSVFGKLVRYQPC